MKKYYCIYLQLIFLISSILFSHQVDAIDYVSNATGAWSNNSTWTPSSGHPVAGDNVTISAAHTVTITVNAVCANLTISGVLKQSAQLTCSGNLTNNGTINKTVAAGVTLILSGNWTNNGPLTGSGGRIFFNGSDKTISGSSNITGTAAQYDWNINGKTTIAAGMTISKSNYITVAGGITVTNFGSVTLTGETINFASASSKWINKTGSTLDIKKSFLGSGTLTASESGNTVKYGVSAATILTPVGSTYYNLTIQNGGTKAAQANLIIDGTLTVGSAGSVNTFNANGKNISVRANIVTAGTTPGITLTNPATLTLDGSSGAQTISGTIAALACTTLTVNNSSGVTCSRPMTIFGTTTLTAGTLTASSTLTFNGTAAQTITGGTGDLVSSGGLTISNAAGVTSSQNISISGATTTLTSGTLTANGTLTFNAGASAQTISGVAGSLISGGGLIISNALGVTCSRPLSIRGAVTLTSGVLTASSTLTFDGSSGAQAIGGAAGSITSSGGLTVNNASGVTSSRSISITGTTTTFTSGALSTSSTITFSGGAAQTITGPGGPLSCTSTGTITITNASGVSTTVPMTISGTVRATSGTFATGATAITVTSVLGNTGRIGDCTGGNITGTNWTIERFVDDADSSWQDVSSPITGADISQWDASLFMSIDNACPDGMANGWPSVYYFDAATQLFDTVSSCSEPLTATRGIEMWLATTLTVFNAQQFFTTGTPTVGTIAASGVASGLNNYTLVGNPYSCYLDWSLIADAGNAPNLFDFFEIYDDVNHNYASWDGSGAGVGTGKLLGTGGRIPPHQGFWVSCNGGGAASLSFKENEKSTSMTNMELVKQAPVIEANILRMKIHSPMMPNAYESVISFRPEATEYRDLQGDILFRKSREEKSPSLTPLTAENEKLAMGAFPSGKQSLDIPILASASLPGEYIIDFKNINLISAYSCFVLEETSSGIKTPLRGDYEYHFKVHNGSDAERTFILHCGKDISDCSTTNNPDLNVRLSSSDAGINVSFYFDKETKTDISVCTVLGQSVMSMSSVVSNNDVLLPLQKTNSVYFVQIKTDSGIETKKIIY